MVPSHAVRAFLDQGSDSKGAMGLDISACHRSIYPPCAREHALPDVLGQLY